MKFSRRRRRNFLLQKTVDGIRCRHTDEFPSGRDGGRGHIGYRPAGCPVIGSIPSVLAAVITVTGNSGSVGSVRRQQCRSNFSSFDDPQSRG